MKRCALFLMPSLAVLLSGCSYTGPARTFQAGNFVCSEKGATIEINEKAADFAARLFQANMMVWEQEKERPPTPQEIENWMKECKTFLK